MFLSLNINKKLIIYNMKLKFNETTFDEYISKKKDLHKNTKILHSIDNKNIIVYGPPGIGKYTETLNYIKRYSETKLKYERKLNITHNKKEYIFKLSDIHFEIDMGMLGCNAKILWNEIYYQVIDIISSRKNKTGIILCKNFHEIHNELLDIFYSYMQKLYHMNINIKYIFISEQVSFIPENILKRCVVIPFKRPTKTAYNKNLKCNINKKFDIKKIKNMKIFKIDYKNLNNVFENINNKLINSIIDYKNLEFLIFRDNIYDIFIYQLNINECIWYIIKNLIEKKYINKDNISEILLKINTFLKYFNNNYRPIYHIESLFFLIIKKIHNF
jgi:hypothetical protein